MLPGSAGTHHRRTPSSKHFPIATILQVVTQRLSSKLAMRCLLAWLKLCTGLARRPSRPRRTFFHHQASALTSMKTRVHLRAHLWLAKLNCHNKRTLAKTSAVEVVEALLPQMGWRVKGRATKQRKYVKSLLLQLFQFNRLVVDEFTGLIDANADIGDLDCYLAAKGFNMPQRALIQKNLFASSSSQYSIPESLYQYLFRSLYLDQAVRL